MGYPAEWMLLSEKYFVLVPGVCPRSWSIRPLRGRQWLVLVQVASYGIKCFKSISGRRWGGGGGGWGCL
jgi:hypothetical protein